MLFSETAVSEMAVSENNIIKKLEYQLVYLAI